MAIISPQDIIEYFLIKGNRFKNKKGMEYGRTDAEDIWTAFDLYDHDHIPLAMSIRTENDSPEEFIHNSMSLS